MRDGHGISGRRIDTTPVAIIDFETTGFQPGPARVVEVSILRMDNEGPPRMLLDTIVNPQSPVAATEIHGITDRDVSGAPTFRELAPLIARSLSGCVVAAYNVSFDMKFLEFEMRTAGFDQPLPHLCLMYMRPLLELGKRATLDAACAEHGIEHESAHVAGSDVQASAKLFDVYKSTCRERGVHTFGDLAALKSYKFTKSFTHEPLSGTPLKMPTRFPRLRSRTPGLQQQAAEVPTPRTTSIDVAIARNWEALKMIVEDLEVDASEVEMMKTIRKPYPLKPEQIRSLHAKAYAAALTQVSVDMWLDDRERKALARLHDCLAQLGWAPGG